MSRYPVRPGRWPRVRSAGTALAVTLTLAGCGREETVQTVADPTAPLDGGTAVVGLFSDLDGLNEFVSTDAVATEVMEYVLYLPLLRWSETYEIEGALARDWQFSEDRRTVTFHKLLEASTLLRRAIDLGLGVHDPVAEQQRRVSLALAALEA